MKTNRSKCVMTGAVTVMLSQMLLPQMAKAAPIIRRPDRDVIGPAIKLLPPTGYAPDAIELMKKKMDWIRRANTLASKHNLYADVVIVMPATGEQGENVYYGTCRLRTFGITNGQNLTGNLPLWINNYAVNDDPFRRDAAHKFTSISIEQNGKVSLGGAFNSSLQANGDDGFLWGIATIRGQQAIVSVALIESTD